MSHKVYKTPSWVMRRTEKKLTDVSCRLCLTKLRHAFLQKQTTLSSPGSCTLGVVFVPNPVPTSGFTSLGTEKRKEKTRSGGLRLSFRQREGKHPVYLSQQGGRVTKENAQENGKNAAQSLTLMLCNYFEQPWLGHLWWQEKPRGLEETLHFYSYIYQI